MGSMSNTAPTDLELPLRILTPSTWAPMVLKNPLELLNDHAHLERKAANNALELLLRWPEPNPPENWVKAMTAIAKDEVEHLALVTRLLARRGGTLERGHINSYAAALRAEVRTGKGEADTVDRLLISALLEVRSCERFGLLADAAVGDGELQELYKSLWASEHGHYRIFLDLARKVSLRGSVEAVEHRWDELLDREAAVIQAQPVEPRMHGWVEATL